MAESNVIAPVFRWANWGIADDVFTWINNSYFSSKNIDIRGNARGISLSKKLTLAIETTGTMHVIMKAKSNMYLAFGYMGTCYRCLNWTWDYKSTSWLW